MIIIVSLKWAWNGKQLRDFEYYYLFPLEKCISSLSDIITFHTFTGKMYGFLRLVFHSEIAIEKKHSIPLVIWLEFYNFSSDMAEHWVSNVSILFCFRLIQKTMDIKNHNRVFKSLNHMCDTVKMCSDVWCELKLAMCIKCIEKESV